jgi:hypothetical protein
MQAFLAPARQYKAICISKVLPPLALSAKSNLLLCSPCYLMHNQRRSIALTTEYVNKIPHQALEERAVNLAARPLSWMHAYVPECLTVTVALSYVS